MAFSLTKYYYLYVLQLVLLGLLIESCTRDKFCDYHMSADDIRIYQELSSKYLADSQIAEQIKTKELSKYAEYQGLIKALDIQSINFKKSLSNECVEYLLLKQETWFMEKDYLILIVSSNNNQSCFDYDESDLQYRLNCNNRINNNMLLRSITVHN